jgi:hypothetical protein
MLALIYIAVFENEKRVLEKEHLLEEWRSALVLLAVGGFIVGVIGHLVQSKTITVTGILLVFVALIIFPVLLWVRGTG